MDRVLVLAAILLLGIPEPAAAGDNARSGRGDPSRYDVVWDSPSKDHSGSMPLGNGEIALNAWVEESGDLVFFIAKTDSWDAYGRLLKVGRLRIALDPPSPAPLDGFEQRLDLSTATLRARYGMGGESVRIRLWVDANRPVVLVEIDSKNPTRATASIELWRRAPVELPSVESSDVLQGKLTAEQKPVAMILEPDSLLTRQRGRIGWFHHNTKSVGPELTATIQGLRGFRREDPLLHRTFGAIVTARNAEVINDLQIRSRASHRHRFEITVLTKHPALPRVWLREVEDVMAGTGLIPPARLRKDHERWWREFWDRSWVHITDSRGPESGDDAYVVSRAYALQRFINACAGRGRFPIKFNGSLFTVPAAGRPGDADYRQWGPGYWWQNTRLPYLSMTASGDFDMMGPLFRMYGRDLMPLFRYRTRHYLNHDGAYIPECIFFWGDVFSGTYGWTPFDERVDKLQESRWHKWEWVSGPELVWMMLEYYEHTLDGEFLRAQALPAAHEVLTFFDQHYPTDTSGRMVMSPSQALETWWECTDPMPEVAGLHAVVRRLLSLPEKTTTRGERAFWREFRKKLPDPPVRTVDGKTLLAPAARFDRKQNIENPELYAVFPFRLYAFNLPGKEIALEAFLQRPDRGNFGWRQDDIFAAFLGLADTVRDYVVGRARAGNAESRFPAFWGPNYDWIPDQDHGGVLLKAIQSMIMQTDGEEIHLLPAWPKEWNVSFKLHAPFRTTIEGTLVNGRIENLSVTPNARRKDIRGVAIP